MLTIGIYGISDTTYYEERPTYAHDHSVVIMKNGEVVSAVQLERYTGIKHDNRLPLSITSIIEKYADIDEDIRLVSVNSFLGNSFISSDGNLRIEPLSKMNVEDIIVPAHCKYYFDGLNEKKVEAYVMCHEFAHVASCLPFIGKLKSNSLMVHIDGGAYNSSSSVWYYDGKCIQCLDYNWNELKYVMNNFNSNPLVCFILGHELKDHLSIPGKLMGYSSYGRANPEIMDWLQENSFFLDFQGNEEELLDIINMQFKKDFKRFNINNSFFMDIAACIQNDFQERVFAFVEKWSKITGAEYLYYSGGAALNIITNSMIEGSGLFKEIFVPPPASDCGLALGAAAYLEYLDHSEIKKQSPFLNNFDVPSYSELSEIDLEEVAEYLQEGKIIGICMGASEIGPRALGHRSIIARADDIGIRKKVSEDIKKREWYRPIAPVVADFVAKKIFTSDICESNLSAYMLGQYIVKEEYRSYLEGVIHVDGSVRAQVIKAGDEENKNLYCLLESMYHKFGTLGLINTSFNISGSPIVHFHEDAYSVAKEMGLDGIVLNDSFNKFE